MAKKLCGVLSALLLTVNAPAQKHPIQLSPNKYVASLQMTAAEYKSWLDNDDFGKSKQKREAIVSDLYTFFDDKFDFIFLVLNTEQKPSTITYFGRLISVSSVISGIGLRQPYNYTANYGSSGKLQSVMALTTKRAIGGGPSLHELMHTWGNFGIVTSAFYGRLYSDYRPHWGFTGGNTPGQLGGFEQSTLQSNVGGKENTYRVRSFGQIANGGNDLPYNELELYLMGMIPLSEVRPFDVFGNITSAKAVENNAYVEFEASRRTRHGSEEIISAFGGRRVPSAQNAQKAFKLLIVVLTPTPLTEAEWTYFDTESEKFGRKGDNGSRSYNFWEATGRRGTIETGDLDKALKTTPRDTTSTTPRDTTSTTPRDTTSTTPRDTTSTTPRDTTSTGSDVVTAIYQDEPTQRKIYPNPAADRVVVVFAAHETGEKRVILTDMLGREVRAVRLGRGEKQYRLDLTPYTEGVYFLHTWANGRSVVEKIILK